MRCFKALILIYLLCLFILKNEACAVLDPLAVPNNKVGVHILDPNEVEKVADLVNGNGGDWGYVTVPLRDDDKDRLKWQRFMDNCQRLHLIPLIRLATVMTTIGWEEPNLYQSLDFANFLADLNWPTQNRYVIIYNEPNHAQEWGGRLDPAGYAKILKYSSQIFKSRSEDFFILPAGLDAAAPNERNCLNLYNFIEEMVRAEPDVFEFIDGWTSHAYPNPGFAGSPQASHVSSLVGYRYERNFLKNFTSKNLPIFITETGWDEKRLSEAKVANYYQTAFAEIWQEKEIVSVTPFVLFAADGPFKAFSLLQADMQPKMAYEVIKNIAKEKGQPQLTAEKRLAQTLGVRLVTESASQEVSLKLPKEKWQAILKWLKFN